MILRCASTLTLGLVLLCGSGLSASAACYAPDQQLPAQAVTDFLGSSNQLLQEPKNAQGGAEMISYVRDLVASNPATLPQIIALIANANPAQQTAIGTGLGQAAALCLRPDPAFAADIQTQLASSTSDNAKNAYAAVTGNQPIRSVAGGGGVSGGSSGGSTGFVVGSTGTGTGFTPFTSSGTSNISTNFFTGGGTSSASSIGTATTSVSP
ncbi:hypothetical protein [Bradyrhizobium sp. JYMT SZCCT0428]|uniref:hypothetical protein n=1 Tax=Bradyrhizobium sp. JYMT SZCCT0428 TaxID=2807673 RepID=UPI001BAC963C|nr:hypothetical protein [Bradyrhizobium sp. JYMT SZCCT0428]MBR1151596.1 hypothetical protein [Bradyrhizobium sp. JYMT SZCCT0428]